MTIIIKIIAISKRIFTKKNKKNKNEENPYKVIASRQVLIIKLTAHSLPF